MTFAQTLSDFIDLLDVVEAIADPEDEQHLAALAIRKAFYDDGLAHDEQSFEDYAENEPTLVPEAEFVEYVEGYAQSIGAVSNLYEWPLSHIDWDAAADELRADYEEVYVPELSTTFLVHSY